MKYLVLCGEIVLALLACTSLAYADSSVPQCNGSDVDRAATARAAGLTRYRASQHTGAGDADMAAALDSFNEACAAGDDTALELRAYALAGLLKYVDAAQSLDAFLVAHPLGTLAPDVRDRVTSQQKEILSHVASLDVDSTPAGVQVSIDHFFVGKTPLRGVRLAPGNYEIEAAQNDSVSQARKVVLDFGSHAESFDFSPPTLIETPTAPPAHPAGSEHHANLRPWAWGTAIGAGAFAVVGVVGAIYANGRGNAYNDFRGGPDADGRVIYCSSASAPSSCADIKSQYGTGLTLGTIGFIGAGALAVTSVTLFYLDIQSKKNDSPANQANRESSHFLRVSCAPWLGAGASCSGAF
jgi:hypothetical protein